MLSCSSDAAGSRPPLRRWPGLWSGRTNGRVIGRVTRISPRPPFPGSPSDLYFPQIHVDHQGPLDQLVCVLFSYRMLFFHLVLFPRPVKPCAPVYPAGRKWRACQEGTRDGAIQTACLVCPAGPICVGHAGQWLSLLSHTPHNAIRVLLFFRCWSDGEHLAHPEFLSSGML